jgi:hypothetical protein
LLRAVRNKEKLHKRAIDGALVCRYSTANSHGTKSLKVDLDIISLYEIPRSLPSSLGMSGLIYLLVFSITKPTMPCECGSI